MAAGCVHHPGAERFWRRINDEALGRLAVNDRIQIDASVIGAAHAPHGPRKTSQFGVKDRHPVDAGPGGSIRPRLHYRNHRTIESPGYANLPDLGAGGRHERQWGKQGSAEGPSHHSAFTIPSTIFLASANSIMVLSRKNSSFSTPAYPLPMPRLMNSTVPAFSTSSTGMP